MDRKNYRIILVAERNMLDHDDWRRYIVGFKEVELLRLLQYNFVRQPTGNHFRHCFLFALSLTSQFCTSMAKTSHIFLKRQLNCKNSNANGIPSCV